MAVDLFTIIGASQAIDRSPAWITNAIKLKKFKAEKLGKQWVIPGKEIRRFKKKPFEITRVELATLSKKEKK